MTLPSSGGLTFAQINAEAGTSFPVTVPNDPWRTLAGVPSGQLVIPTDFYGKSSFAFEAFSGAAGQSVSGLAFGPAGPTRRLIAVLHFEGTSGSEPTVTACNIGGVAAAVHFALANWNAGTSAFIGTAVASALVPTGTSGTVSYALSVGAASASGVGVYREIRGFGSGITSAGDIANNVTKPAVCDVSVNGSGVDGGIAIAGSTMSTALEIITWQSGPTVINNYSVGVGNMYCAGCYQKNMVTQTLTTRSSWATGGLYGMALAASTYTPQFV